MKRRKESQKKGWLKQIEDLGKEKGKHGSKLRKCLGTGSGEENG